MKKILIGLVAVFSISFAGGDISPVEPIAPASADFWGQIGFAAQVQDGEKYSWDDEQNNAFSATVVMGVEKEIGNGFGFGVEVAGWTNFGLDSFAIFPRVKSIETDSAEVSQAYVTFKYANTSVKAGRVALAEAVSPWVWSDRTAGVIDVSYDGVFVANTDVPDTTIIGGFVKNVAVDMKTHEEFNTGLFMATVLNKSIPGTIISGSAYYFPENNLDLNYAGAVKDTWSVWGAVESQFSGGVYGGLQGAYADGDYTGTDATYAFTGKIGYANDIFDLHGILGYVNDGSYSLIGAGSGIGTSALWIDYEIDGDIMGEEYYAGLVKASYKLPVGSVYGGIGYWNFDGKIRNEAFGGRLGYKFGIGDVETKIEYRYLDTDYVTIPNVTRQRVRVEAFYKF